MRLPQVDYKFILRGLGRGKVKFHTGYPSCLFASLKRKLPFFPTYTLKINMEHNHGGLEDHFPFSSWVICRFHVNLPGCTMFHLLFFCNKNLIVEFSGTRYILPWKMPLKFRGLMPRTGGTVEPWGFKAMVKFKRNPLQDGPGHQF